MRLFVATEGDYDDYHVVGVFSSYDAASAAGDNVFVTVLDEPRQAVGAYMARVAIETSKAWDNAPAYIYTDPENQKFERGDLIYEGWLCDWAHETPAVVLGQSAYGYGPTRESARQAAAVLAGVATPNTHIWDTVAVNKDRWPQEPPK